MPDILGQIICPIYGDITMDVARELAAQRQQDEAETLAGAHARQALIAAEAGQHGRTFKSGHQIAQIDARVHDYWRRREGKDFWRHELKFMLKRHPELRVESKPENPTVRVERKVGAKRGRWAA